MFTMADEQVRDLATTSPDTIGILLLQLVLPRGWDEAIDFAPRGGWLRANPGEAAAGRFAGCGMRGYTNPERTVVLTAVDVQGDVPLVAEGAGWAIGCDGQYGGWIDLDNLRTAGGIAPIGIDNEIHPCDAPDRTVMWEDRPLLSAADDQPAAPRDDRPSWLRPGYDWDAHVAADPTNSLSRIHRLASPLGLDWTQVDDSDRPTAAMMNRIETALRLETSEPPAGHRLTLGRRIEAAETAMAASAA